MEPSLRLSASSSLWDCDIIVSSLIRLWTNAYLFVSIVPSVWQFNKCYWLLLQLLLLPLVHTPREYLWENKRLSQGKTLIYHLTRTYDLDGMELEELVISFWWPESLEKSLTLERGSYGCFQDQHISQRYLNPSDRSKAGKKHLFLKQKKTECKLKNKLCLCSVIGSV